MNKLIKQAFTLIELLVVIAIIGILSGLIVVSMGGMTQKATIAKAQVFSNSLKNSLMLNLVSEWRFDELTTAVQGTTIQDSWNGGNNLTLDTNSDGLEKLKANNCVSGKCLSFDGIDDYAYVPGSDSTTSNLAITGAITLSAWVRFTVSGTNGVILSRGPYTGDGNYGYVLWRYGASNNIYFTTYSTTATDNLISNTAMTDNNWHLITATWDGTTSVNGKKIYIDVELSKQGTSTISAMGQPSWQFKIGEDGWGSYNLNGLVDEVRVYKAAIPSSQIREQYYAGLNNLLANGGISEEEYSLRISNLAINNKQ